jgi:hypothetical protein
VRLTWPKPNREIGVVDALGLTGLCGLLVARVIPFERLPFWGCAWREVTGWPCLGCGLTRVAIRVSHFDFAGAWDANPLGTVFASLFVVAIVAAAVHLAFKVPLPQMELTPREWRYVRIALGIVVLVNYAWVAVNYRYPGLIRG